MNEVYFYKNNKKINARNYNRKKSLEFCEAKMTIAIKENERLASYHEIC